MNYSLLIQHSARLVWGHKFLWLLGFLLGLGNVTSGAARVALLAFLPGLRMDNAELWLEQLATRLIAPGQLELFGAGATAATAVLIVAALLYWILITLAEAILIVGAYRLWLGKPVTPGQMVIAGSRLLGRFIAIDAIVFFPWFVLALLAMGVFMAAMVGMVALSTQSESIIPAMGLFTTGIICAGSLACLLLPVGFASLIYRLLAFRTAAILNAGVRHAVRHTWNVIRTNGAHLLILAALIWGLQYAATLLLNVLGVPLATLAAVPSRVGWSSFVGITSAAVAATGVLLIVWLKALLTAFTATLWTLAYTEMVRMNGGQDGIPAGS